MPLILIRDKIERKKLNFLKFGKNVISEISGRLLIGQYDSLGVLLLVDTLIKYIKGRYDLTNTFGG